MAIILDSTEWNVSIIGIVPLNSTVVGDKGQAGQLSKQGGGPIWPEGSAARVGALGGPRLR